MANFLRRIFYHDHQTPRLYRAGVLLRRTFLLGPAATPEETSLQELLDQVDRKTGSDKQ